MGEMVNWKRPVGSSRDLTGLSGLRRKKGLRLGRRRRRLRKDLHFQMFAAERSS